MKHFSVMLKPASGSCNMRCTYCFYADLTRRRSVKSYGMMTIETAKKIVDNILPCIDISGNLTMAFQGGEPTLAGISFYQELFDYIDLAKERRSVQYALQTNGLIIDESWCQLLSKAPVLVGISIDGNMHMHDAYRTDAKGGATFRRIIQSKKLLDQYNIPYNILSVLTSQNARHPQKLWNFLMEENINFVQFIPCLDELENNTKSPYALTPERFYSFYRAIFPPWFNYLKSGRYISIKLFDDLLNYYVKGIPTACGINGKCGIQYVVEGDGTTFPCDFYTLDEYSMGSLASAKPDELFKNGIPFVSSDKSYIAEEPCKNCKYLGSCAGGCKRMKDSMYISKGVCFYSKLLDEILPALVGIGKQLMHQGK